MNFAPRWYQQEAIDAIFNYLNGDDPGHPLVCLPTGSGKSLVQAMIVDEMSRRRPSARILFLTHQQELIRQNFNELIANMGALVDAGIYSAGLDSRDTDNKIIFAGIQSVHKKADDLGQFNLVVIDEAHLIPKKGEGMYRTFLSGQASFTKFVGLTATPYRLESGLLTEGPGNIFDEIIYDVSVKRLIDDGFLCRLIGKNGVVRPDVSLVHRRGKEFIENELAAVCDDSVLIRDAVAEMLSLTEDRKHVIIFCVGIAHAEHVRDEIERQGQECYCIHSKMPDDEKEKIIKDFKDKKIKYITNVDMLTTGFNARHIDCIVMMRPTLSAGLYYQVAGRGLRIDDGKTDCLILDYAGNILQHGPIDKIEIKTKGMASDRGVHTAPMKECPQCREIIFAVTVTCPHCGYKYPVNDAPSHNAEASTESPLSEYRPPAEHEVMDVSYLTHEKNNRLSMRVVYHTGLMDSVSEWVCIEHGGYAEQKARQWLKKMLPDGYPIPDTVEECLDLKNEYKKPSVIYVDYNQKFPRIISKVFNDDSVSPELVSS